MKSPGQVPTIYDIARVAGVSANTVSRAINGKPGVKDTTRARILAIAQEIDYHPNIGARSLRVGREGVIGLTMPAPVDIVPISQALFTFIFAELYRIFGSRGERICFDLNPFNASPEADYGRSLWQKLYSACVVAGPCAVDDRVIPRIHRSGIPYVALSRSDSLPECSSATVDLEAGAFESTKLMIDRGHSRVAMLKAFSGYQPGVERRRGYARALDAAGIAIDESLVRSVTFHTRDVANAVHRLLKDSTVTALVDASGVEDGSCILEGARRAGRVPGKDFEIVTWTYSSRAVIIEEACMHLWLPVREATAEGLELLGDWYFEKRDGPIHVLYPPTMLDTKDLISTADGKATRPDRLFDALF